MSDELAKLILKMEAETGNLIKELEKTKKKLSGFEKKANDTAKKTEDAFTRLEKSIKKSLKDTTKSIKQEAAAFTSLVVAGFGYGVIEISKNMEQLRIQLETITGSAEGAAAAFEGLQDFASETPYQLEELITAFVKLKGAGLDPSKKALISYGNTASALGKDLSMMIEAITDAGNFEFQRLKEQFNITAKQSADSVAFTFQGVTTVIDKNAKAITRYLQDIGNTQFAGAMEKQAKTLAGAFSNLQGAMTKALTVQGPELDNLTNSIRELTATVEDPKVIKGIQSLSAAIVRLGAGITRTAASFTRSVESISQSVGTLIHGAIDADGALKIIQDKIHEPILRNDIFKNKGLDVDDLIDDYSRLEKLISFASVDQIKSGLASIAKQTEQFKSMGADSQLSTELQILKDLRELYLDALDAKGEFADKDSKTSDLSEFAPKDSDIKPLTDYEKRMQKLAETITRSVDPQAQYNAQVAQLDEIVKAVGLDQGIYNLKLAEYKEILDEATDGIQNAKELNQALADTFTQEEAALINVRQKIDDLIAAQAQFPDSADKITEAIARLRAEEQELTTKTDDMAEELQSISDQAARNMQNIFADFLFDPFDEGVDGMLKSFQTMVQRMVAEKLALKAMAGLEGLFDTGESGGDSKGFLKGIGSFAKDLFSFDGGGFTGNGPRIGGLDGKGGYMAMVHPNETIIDHTKGQGAQPVHVNFNITANDTRGFEDLLNNSRGMIANMMDQALRESGRTL